ncbi:glutaredoxin family protein [candidate division KSB1 bacterium]|nr:glutaredoxin family protein [candidate division KSB1 bacterium]
MFEQIVKQGTPLLLALSTCPRCIRMKKFLKMHNISAEIVDVDLLPLDERRSVYRFLKPFNPRLSFPTLIVGDSVVIGEEYDEVKEVLNL